MARPRKQRATLLSALARGRLHFQEVPDARPSVKEFAALLGVSYGHASKVLQRLQHERVVERMTAYRRRADR